MKVGIRWLAAIAGLLFAFPAASSAKTMTGKLVNDGDDNGTWSTTFTVKKGSAFTVWMVDDVNSINDVSYPDDFDTDTYDFPPSFDMVSDSYTQNSSRWILWADSWDEEGNYPSSIKYTVTVTGGEIGDTFTLNYQEGEVQETVPAGTDGNPTTINPTTTVQSQTVTPLNGSYYFRATLTAGQQYFFGTVDATTNSIDLGFNQTNNLVMTAITNSADWADSTHTGYKIVPTVSGTYLIEVTSATAATIKLSYKKIGARLPAAHAATDVGTPSNEESLFEFSPAYRNHPNSGYFDNVIDDQLFQATLAKGTTYLFAARVTSTATAPIVMELYDAKGNVLLQNRSAACGTAVTNALVSFKPATAGTYWVGVCQDIADEDAQEPVAGVKATLTAMSVDPAADDFLDAADQTAVEDSGDPNTDVTGLAPGAAATNSTGIHTFSHTDWTDTYRIDARKGITYAVSLASETTNGISGDCLAYTGLVYTLSGTTKKAVASVADLKAGYSLAAAANVSYYIQAGATDAQGVRSAYSIRSIATSATGVGQLTVNLNGPATGSATWSLAADGSSAPKYASGATILLPAGSYQIKFSAVSGWSTPANQTVTVAANGSQEVAGNYNDTFDPKDDTVAGATSIKPLILTSDPASESFAGGLAVDRSLWSGDNADWFSFSVGMDNEYYYRFAVVKQSVVTDGDIALTLYSDKGVTEKAFNANGVTYLGKGTYYLKVARGTSFSGTYRLRVGYFDLGAVKFEKAAYSFAENAAAAIVRITRTGSSAVSVRYTTVADTAKPDENYVATKGTLAWAAGDKSAKTLSIPLIPNLYATWESNKTFAVALTMEPGTPYSLIGTISNTVVTLKEVSRQTPGTLAFTGTGDSEDAIEAFADTKKPAAAIPYGESKTFWIERTVGSNGRVGATIATIKGTGVAGTDFVMATTNLYWEDGETGAKPFTVTTLSSDLGYRADKTLTLKLTVDSKAGAKATAGASSVAVTLSDPAVGTRLENSAYAKILAGSKATWFFTADGSSLQSVPLAQGKSESLTLSLTGPGRLIFTPSLTGDTGINSFTATIGKQTVDCTSGEQQKLYLGKGKQSVKFTVTRGRTSEAAEQVYASFALEQTDDGDNVPYLWTALESPTVVAPIVKSFAHAGDLMLWSDNNAGDVLYNIYADSSTSLLGKTNALVCAEEIGDRAYLPDSSSFVPGKTYSWRVDSVMLNDDGDIALVNTNASVWTFTVAATNAPMPILVDDSGAAVDASDGLTLVQGVAVRYPLGCTNSETAATYKLASGKFPAGLALAKDKAGVWAVSGIPTATGTYAVAIQAVAGRVTGGTVQLDFTVEPIRLAEGTFNGILAADSTAASTNLNEQIGSATFTASAAGRISAKVQIGTKSYSFSGSGYTTNTAEGADGQPGLGTTLTSLTTFNRKVYTNTLDLTVCRSDGLTNECWVTKLGIPTTAKLTMNLLTLDNKGVQTNLVFTGNLYRNNTKDVQGLAALAAWVGYYTVSLPPATILSGAPQGVGYLTVTLDAKGGVKLAGVLADGNAWSASTTAAYFGGDCSGDDELVIPVFTAKNKYAFGGWLCLKHGDISDGGNDVFAVTSSDSSLYWYNADPAATYDAQQGFGFQLYATGGYYDKLFNLQHYYLDRPWAIASNDALTIPDEITNTVGAANNTLLVNPEGLALTLVGDTITVDKRSLVKQSSSSKLYDLSSSVNPGNLNIRLTRATGIFNGTFSLWFGNAELGSETQQKELSGLKYQGVLTPYKADDTAYANNPGMGFFLLPVKVTRSRTWTGSYPFSVDAEYTEPETEGWDD